MTKVLHNSHFMFPSNVQITSGQLDVVDRCERKLFLAQFLDYLKRIARLFSKTIGKINKNGFFIVDSY